MKKSFKRNASILGLCDSVTAMLHRIRAEYINQTACQRELLCGEWISDNYMVSYLIFVDKGKFKVEQRFSNPINGRVKRFNDEVLEDEQGNLYFKNSEAAIRYDRDKDIMVTESFGEFRRKQISRNE